MRQGAEQRADGEYDDPADVDAPVADNVAE